MEKFMYYIAFVNRGQTKCPEHVGEKSFAFQRPFLI